MISSLFIDLTELTNLRAKSELAFETESSLSSFFSSLLSASALDPCETSNSSVAIFSAGAFIGSLEISLLMTYNYCNLNFKGVEQNAYHFTKKRGGYESRPEVVEIVSY